MKLRRVTLIVLFCLFLLGFGMKGYGQSITVQGNWNLTIDESDLQGGPGTDLIDTYESTGFYRITVRYGNFFNDWYWRVDVSKSDINWHSNFGLDIRRTGDGFGFGSISGGTSYQEITDTDQSFFSGFRNRMLITFQYRLRNVSVQIPPDTYETTVWLTVTEI